MKKLSGGYWCWAAPHQWNHTEIGWLSVITRDERGYTLTMSRTVTSIRDAQRITHKVIAATESEEK